MSNKIIKDRDRDIVNNTNSTNTADKEVLTLTVGNRVMTFNQETYPYAVRLIIKHWISTYPYKAGYWNKWKREREKRYAES